MNAPDPDHSHPADADAPAGGPRRPGAFARNPVFVVLGAIVVGALVAGGIAFAAGVFDDSGSVGTSDTRAIIQV